MDNAIEIKNKIIQYSQQIGIDLIGFTSAESFDEQRPVMEDYWSSGFSSGFEEQDLEKRVNPRANFSAAKTIISIALAYPQQAKGELNRNQGSFCRASWGEDYHRVVEEKLDQLSTYINQLDDGVIQCQRYVDTGPLSDRSVAQRAGLGWIGRNSNLITEQFGSFVYLGELITDIALPVDEPSQGSCGDCYRCVKACPLEAIDGEKRWVNCQRCLAYLTLDKKYPSDEIAREIGRRGYIYGCDICQLVCPYNQGKENEVHEEFRRYSELNQVDLCSLLTMSNKEFKQQFGPISGSWRGKKVLQRNAIFILGYRKSVEALPLLQQISKTDEREDIRQAAINAIKEIGNIVES